MFTIKNRVWIMTLLLSSVMAITFTEPAQAAKSKKPNILVIWGDDIGITNISAYSRGMMGFFDLAASQGR